MIGFGQPHSRPDKAGTAVRKSGLTRLELALMGKGPSMRVQAHLRRAAGGAR